MSGLSHGVVRVDQDNSLTSLTLQDCGQVGIVTLLLPANKPQEMNNLILNSEVLSFRRLI